MRDNLAQPTDQSCVCKALSAVQVSRALKHNLSYERSQSCVRFQHWANYGLSLLAALEHFGDVLEHVFIALMSDDVEVCGSWNTFVGPIAGQLTELGRVQVTSRACGALQSIVTAPGEDAFEAKYCVAHVCVWYLW